jgi:outer membrane protein OmpA-like peptidoglycan-associated protein
MKKIIIFVLFAFFACAYANAQGVGAKKLFIYETPEKYKKVKNWKFEVFEKGLTTPVRVFKGLSEVPEKITWDGKDNNGNIVPDGTYTGTLTVVTKKQTHTPQGAAYIVDNTVPLITLNVAEDILFVTEGKLPKGAQMDLSASDETGIDFKRTNLEIFTQKKAKVKTFTFNGFVPEYILWDGIDDYYNRMMPAGQYNIVFTVYDEHGNSSQVKSRITLVDYVPPKIEAAKVAESPKGLVINLSSSVLFASGESKLLRGSQKSMDQVIEVLKAYPSNKVVIAGHTDSSGNEAKNIELSLKRAQSVRDYIVSKGIDEARLTVQGFGSKQEAASNATVAGRALNRRVEIIILKESVQGAASSSTVEAGSVAQAQTSQADPVK